MKRQIYFLVLMISFACKSEDPEPISKPHFTAVIDDYNFKAHTIKTETMGGARTYLIASDSISGSEIIIILKNSAFQEDYKISFGWEASAQINELGVSYIANRPSDNGKIELSTVDKKVGVLKGRFSFSAIRFGTLNDSKVVKNGSFFIENFNFENLK
ncbi:hypothetical protein [Marivirga sp.]|uniref:hypothetical protein n=1 Tax=Marivirga sp. TaxID=2018662 RepID=UPI003DA7700C